MTTYEMLSGNAQGLLLLWAATALLLMFYCFIRFIQQGRVSYAIASAAALMSDYVLVQIMVDILAAANGNSAGRGFSLPAAAVLLPLLLLTMAGLMAQHSIVGWRKTHITGMSVRQAFDDLPAGLCYFWAGGLTKLTNNRMDAVCRGVSGRALLDAEAFWGDLRAGRVRPGAECVRAGDEPIVRLPNGSVYSFHLQEMAWEGRSIYELAAIDVTREYEVSVELQEKRGRADALNRRLRALNAAITAMTVEKETLSAKTRLHNEFGTALLMAKRFLCEPEQVDRTELLSMWRRVTAMLRDAGPNSLQGAYIDVLRSAYLLGAEIELDGALPELSPMRELAVLAISTCLTNMLRHAQGTRMHVRCESGPDAYALTIQNDGRPPERPIIEGGGLGNLRRRVEAVGGAVRVETAPRFVLFVSIPKEVKTDGERTDRG